MVKRILSILLILSFVSLNLSKVIILVNYQLNKKEITQKYCVNKDKPWMHCCGKCHLKKELAKNDAQQKGPDFSNARYDIILYNGSDVFHFPIPLVSSVNMAYIYNDIRPSGVLSAVFHPPCA